MIITLLGLACIVALGAYRGWDWLAVHLARTLLLAGCGAGGGVVTVVFVIGPTFRYLVPGALFGALSICVGFLIYEPITHDPAVRWLLRWPRSPKERP